MGEDIVAMARAAMRDERLSDGALYGKLADCIEQLEAEVKRLRFAIEYAKVHLLDTVKTLGFDAS